MDAHVDDERELVRRLAHAEIEFKRIRLHPPYLTRAHRTFSVLRQVARETRGNPQRILQITGPSHTGKSSIVRDYVEWIAREETPKPGCHPVVWLELSPKAKLQTLGSDIIRALKKDALPAEVISDIARSKGADRAFRDRSATGQFHEILHVAVTVLRLAEVELLVLDEAQHLSPSETAKVTNNDVTESIKWIANQGVCPIVCVGPKRLRGLLASFTNAQVANRSVEPILLDPLDYTDHDDFVSFNGYLDALDAKIVAHGILPQFSDFLKDDWPECFYDVSKGVVGRVSRLIEAAANYAIEEGSPAIQRKHLDRATRKWAIAQEITKHNPWSKGPRDVAEVLAEASLVE